MTIPPENITALIAAELRDARFHRAMAERYYGYARQVRPDAQDRYVTQGDEHATAFRVCYGNAIGFASRPEGEWDLVAKGWDVQLPMSFEKEIENGH